MGRRGVRKGQKMGRWAHRWVWSVSLSARAVMCAASSDGCRPGDGMWDAAFRRLPSVPISCLFRVVRCPRWYGIVEAESHGILK